MAEYGPKIDLRRSLLVIAVVVALIGLTVWLLKPELFSQMFEAIRTANGLFLGLAIATYFFSVVLWTVRWHIAIRSIDGDNPKTSFSALFSIICSAIFLNNVTPLLHAGGDPFGRVYLVRKLENVKYPTAIVASLGEHIFAPPILISFLVAGLFLQFGEDVLGPTGLLLVVGALVVSGLVVFPRFFVRRMIGVSAISSLVTRVARVFGRRTDAQQIAESVSTFYASAYVMMSKRREGLAIASLTSLMLVLTVARFHIVFLALGYSPRISMLLLAASLPTILGFVPFLPGGLVIVEGSLISVFAIFGVSLDIATAATLIERGISFALSSLVGAVVFVCLGLRMAVKTDN
jgi:uncharacterized protein (TIRG00374 family)